jgi:hypothetical protein
MVKLGSSASPACTAARAWASSPSRARAAARWKCAAATQSDVLITGVAGLVAGAISMAAGESYHGRGGDKTPSRRRALVNIAQFSNLFLFGTNPGWLKLV